MEPKSPGVVRNCFYLLLPILKIQKLQILAPELFEIRAVASIGFYSPMTAASQLSMETIMVQT